MSLLLSVTSALVVAYLLTFVYRFFDNYNKARKTNLPMIVVPWDQNHIIWMLASPPLKPWLQKNLPKFIWRRITYTIYGWEFHERLRPFVEYCRPDDRSFMLVTCGKRLECWTSDAEFVTQVLSRPKDFHQMDLTELFMSRFGPNVLTSNGERWARHRKIVASVINERISKAVFNETVRQTEGLLNEVTKNDTETTSQTDLLFDMAKKITIHVLSGAGMGTSVNWDDNSNEKPEPGFKQTYMQSVKTVINNVSGPIILPSWIFWSYPSFLPGYTFMKQMGHAVDEFPKHTKNLLDQERSRSHNEGVTRNNIISQFLQASEAGADSESQKSDGAKTRVLSDSELLGNLFVVTAAGFDTTANTLSYGFALLARHTEWQDWLLEEIDEIVPSDSTVELDYVSTFPKAIRLMAFMQEILRLFTPLIHLSKQNPSAQTVQTSKGTYKLPADTSIYVNTIALHADRNVWHHLNLKDGEKGIEDDVWLFRPSRWINPSGSQQPLFQPPKGSYVPWSTGPRVCPGQKMSQIEFVSVFLTLLRRHKIEAAPLPGESRLDVEKRLDQRMRKSISILTLQMDSIYDVSGSGKGLTLQLSRRR